jgi:hypothetical protein
MAEILGFLVTLIGAGQADRDVDIGAQVAVLHVAVAGAEVAQDLAQLADIGRRLFGAAQVGAADDLHQRHAGAVEVDEGHVGIHVVDRLARVLFQMDALDPHQTGEALAHLDQHFSLADDRVVKLGNLIALRQIGVEIILAVKRRPEVDLGLEAKPREHRLFDAEIVDHRQHARHRGVDEGDVGIGLGPEQGRGTGEQLGVRGHLGVDLHPDH